MKEKSEKIKRYLESRKLRNLLVTIDDAQSRLYELSNQMNKNPDFLKFVDCLLEEMGLMDN